MPLISSKNNLILTWSSTCAITSSSGAKKCAIIDTTSYVSIVILLPKDSTKLL